MQPQRRRSTATGSSRSGPAEQHAADGVLWDLIEVSAPRVRATPEQPLAPHRSCVLEEGVIFSVADKTSTVLMRWTAREPLTLQAATAQVHGARDKATM